MEFAANLVAAGPAKPKKLPDTEVKRQIALHVRDGRQYHDQNKDSDNEPARQGVGQSLAETARLELAFEFGLLRVRRGLLLLSHLRFFVLRARLDCVFIKLDDSNQSDQTKRFQDFRNFCGACVCFLDLAEVNINSFI